jgi:hypothetical protein
MEKNRSQGTFHDPKTFKSVFKDQWVIGIPQDLEKTNTLTGIKVLSHGKDLKIVGFQARNLIGDEKKVVVINTSQNPMLIVAFDAKEKPVLKKNPS